jgi:hypothetical protein
VKLDELPVMVHGDIAVENMEIADAEEESDTDKMEDSLTETQTVTLAVTTEFSEILSEVQEKIAGVKLEKLLVMVHGDIAPEKMVPADVMDK